MPYPSESGGSSPAASSSTYYPAFDYLRIALALGVFSVHAGMDVFHGMLPNFGNFCVQIFFALSGFLIGGILRDSTADSLPRFYFNRSTRIWIPYFIAILLLAAACFVKHQPLTAKVAEFFFDKATFTYDFYGPPQLGLRAQMPLQGTGHHFWSICVEEQFYLLAPFLIIVLGRYAAWGICAAGALACSKYPEFFASITLGVLLALSERRWGKWYRRPAALLSGILALVALACLCRLHPERYDLLSPAESVLIVGLMSKSGRPAPAGPFLGGISYPFYLNHWIGLMFMNRVAQWTRGSNAVAILVALAISLAVSSIHYCLVDRSIHRKRAAWFTRRRGLVCASFGFALVAVGVAVNVLWVRRT